MMMTMMKVYVEGLVTLYSTGPPKVCKKAVIGIFDGK